MCQIRHEGFAEDGGGGEFDALEMQRELGLALHRFQNLTRFINENAHLEPTEEGIRSAISEARNYISADQEIIKAIYAKYKNGAIDSGEDSESLRLAQENIAEMEEKLAYLELSIDELKQYDSLKKQIEARYQS